MSKLHPNSISERLAERKFKKWKAVKRNKNIFNIDEINNFEDLEQKRRRTPSSTVCTGMSDKFNQSFMNSTAVYTCKLESEIERHKTKVNSYFHSKKRNTTDVYYENREQSTPKQKTKGVSIEKMLTREYRESLDPQPTRDEMRFNNFTLMKTDEGRTRGFQKYISREDLDKLMITEVPDSNPEVPIIYEKTFYPSNTFNANWSYKMQKWDRGPKFFTIQKQNSANLNQIDSDSIEHGRNLTTAKWNRTLTNFNSSSTKQNEAQIQRTFYPPNMQFRARKTNISLNSKIKIKVKTKPDPEFNRWELCDIKYFRLKTDKDKRNKRAYTQ